MLPSLPELSLRILDHAREHGRVSPGAIIKLTGVSRNTLKQQLQVGEDCASFVEEQSSFYLTWDELRTMAGNGNWDVQEHAGVGHVNVRYDAAVSRSGRGARHLPAAHVGRRGPPG